MGHDEELFEQHRATLIGLAYRLLGSMQDAEDAVQDAWLRWVATDRASVSEPRAYLMTVVSRLAFDQLKASRRLRDSYVGPWLPEPADTESLGPLDSAELQETVSFGMLHVLERLTPPERAVFVLREAFDMPYDDVASVVGSTPSNCRKILSRARHRIATNRAGTRPTRAEHERLLTSFIDAAREGDLHRLTGLLSEDVVAWNDGGGRVRAARRPIRGRQRVIGFVSALADRFDIGEPVLVSVNGQPALLTRLGGLEQVLMLDVKAGRIQALYAVLNPDKLTRLEAG